MLISSRCRPVIAGSETTHICTLRCGAAARSATHVAQPPPSKGCNDVVWLESKSPPLSVQPQHLPFTKIPMVGLADIRGHAQAQSIPNN